MVQYNIPPMKAHKHSAANILHNSTARTSSEYLSSEASHIAISRTPNGTHMYHREYPIQALQYLIAVNPDMIYVVMAGVHSVTNHNNI